MNIHDSYAVYFAIARKTVSAGRIILELDSLIRMLRMFWVSQEFIFGSGIAKAINKQFEWYENS